MKTYQVSLSMPFRAARVFGTVSTALLLTIAAMADTTTQGTYTVPAPDILKDVATFNLNQVDVAQNGSHINIVYKLPPELVGETSSSIVLDGELELLNGQPQPFKVTGPKASGTCTQSATDTTCNLKLTPAVLNPDAAKTFIDRTVTDPNRHDKLIEVLARFGGDPIGIFVYHD